MTPYVLTMIGDLRSAPLGRDHVDRVFRHLRTTGEVEWLAEGEACDIFFDSPLAAAALTESVRDALSETEIDVVCTATDGRRKKLLVSDMDSTVIDQECIDELGDALGVGALIREITAAVVNGDISFSDALRRRMALMKGMDRCLLESVYSERISLMSGARTLVQTMRQHGAFCVLVSGGFSFFTRRIAEAIGFHDHQGNDLAFADGKLTGDVLEPILGRTAKLVTLTRLCQEKGLRPADVLAVGDGANDIKMVEAAGLGVAYHGAESLRKQANARIDHRDLTALLYVQGYRKSEFVLS